MGFFNFFRIPAFLAFLLIANAAKPDNVQDTQRHLLLTGLNFPVKNHLRMFRESPNLLRLRAEWTSRWMSILDPYGVIFLSGDIPRINSALDLCIQRVGKEIYFQADCFDLISNIYRSRLMEFVQIATYMFDERKFETSSSRRYYQGKSIYMSSFQADEKAREDRIQATLSAKVIKSVLDGASLSESYDLLFDWIELQRTNLDHEKNQRLIDSFLNSYYQAIDPHSAYLNPQKISAYNELLRPDRMSIGVKLSANETGELIMHPLPGSAAAIAGINEGDVLVSITESQKGTVVVRNMDPLVAEQLLSGPQGSPVTVFARRFRNNQGDECSEELAFELTREPISRDAELVRTSIYQKGRIIIAVFSAGTFYKGMSQHIAAMLNEVKLRFGEPRGIVLDLSGNKGGRLDEALAVAGLFSKSGPIALSSKLERNALGLNFVTRVLEDPSPDDLYRGPLVVKIDEESASASEIVAAFLQDSKRAVVVGHRSNGKGTIQEIFPALHSSARSYYSRFEHILPQTLPKADRFEHGAYKVTVGKFYRITGKSTQFQGVRPDLYFYPEDFDQTSLYESMLPEALIPDETSPLPSRYDEHKFVKKFRKSQEKIQSAIRANFWLGMISTQVQNRIAQMDSPQPLDLKQREENRQNERLITKKVNETLAAAPLRSQFIRSDMYFSRESLAISINVVSYRSSSDAARNHHIRDPWKIQEEVFKFEKSRIEMDEILQIFQNLL